MVVQVIAQTLNQRRRLGALLGRVHVRGEDGQTEVAHKIWRVAKAWGATQLKRRVLAEGSRRGVVHSSTRVDEFLHHSSIDPARVRRLHVMTMQKQ